MNNDSGALLQAARAGDQAAWAAIVDRHTGLLWSIARGYRLGMADGGDAIQNTWLRLAEHLDRIDQPDRLGGWLATTMRRECLQLLRRTARQAVATDDDRLAEMPDNAKALDAGLLHDEVSAALWRAVGALSDKCQRLLRVLMASPPPAYAEVSAALDMPIGSIGPARQRCLAHLRAIVAADELLADSATTLEAP
ncbi:RNA polymerase sigma factor [Actinokineospora sp.]|uniref:RNA polymerase sigma factor n=1 Tax=Actinokineospora sp. TaxID=1872133 RepID=UPI004038253F